MITSLFIFLLYHRLTKSVFYDKIFFVEEIRSIILRGENMAKKVSKQKSYKRARREHEQKTRQAVKSHNLPPVAGTYFLRLKGVIPEAFRTDGQISVVCRTELFCGRFPTYFGFTKYWKDFKNPFFRREDELEKILGKRFGIDTRYGYSLVESEEDRLIFVLSKDLNERIDKKIQPAFHGILFATGDIKEVDTTSLSDFMLEHLE